MAKTTEHLSMTDRLYNHLNNGNSISARAACKKFGFKNVPSVQNAIYNLRNEGVEIVLNRSAKGNTYALA